MPSIKQAKDLLRPMGKSPLLHHTGLGILVGIITGLVVGLFRWIIDHTLVLLTIIYPFMKHHSVWLVLYIIAIIVIVWLIAYLVQPYKTDLIGSGVPQLKAILKGRHHMDWWHTNHLSWIVSWSRRPLYSNWCLYWSRC